MSRYIEVDKAMELCDAFYFTNETCSVKWLFDNAPTIEIVRCKECTMYAPLDDTRAYDCEIGLSVFPDDFCSFGERRK